MPESSIEAAIDPLSRLAAGLPRFRQASRRHLDEARTEVRQIMEKMREARRQASAEVRCLRQEVARSSDEDDVSGLEHALAGAEDSLESVERAQSDLEEAVAEYERAASRFTRATENGLPRAEAFLTEKQHALLEIRRIQLDPSAPSSAAHAGSGAGSSLSPASADATAGLDLTQQALPSGFQWVKLTDLNLEETLGEIRSPADFRPYASFEVMQEGLHMLQTVVLPAIAQRGYSADSFHFMREDRRAQRSYEHGAQRVYDAFFGNEPIAVQRDPATSGFTIVNGRHRVFTALESQWTAVPVRIAERTK